MGNIQLAFCPSCGHIFNTKFEPDQLEYSQEYENSLHFSPFFQDYAKNLASRLIRDYNLIDKEAIDIGCGKGDFLKILCEQGIGRGIGFDPGSPEEDVSNDSYLRIAFIQDFYSEKYLEYKADLICCRHVLEHIQKPINFLKSIRKAIGNNLETIVFFEVPNIMYTLKELGIWDLIYEHCGYFSENSLNYIFTSCGFKIAKLRSTFKGQFLCVEAMPVRNRSPIISISRNVEEIKKLVSVFFQEYFPKIEKWRKKIESIGNKKQRAVVWGAGSKGVTFLNTMKAQKEIEFVIDINTRKQGMFIAGTGQQIMPPEFIRNYKPDKIIILNSLYLKEIKRAVNNLDLSCEFLIA